MTPTSINTNSDDQAESPIDGGKTVRQRKANPKAATQRFLPIAEIRNDLVLLKNGGVRAILQVDAINFHLKSETEQKGIISGYQSFMNTLHFPLQIVVRSMKLNIDPYIHHLQQLSLEQKNPLLRKQMVNYATFVEKLVDVADIMQKRFYVVVPVDDNDESSKSITQMFNWFQSDDTSAKAISRNSRFEQKKSKIRDRLNLVEIGLNNIGLRTTRLNTRELIELFYDIYNPKTSQEQRLPQDINTEKMVL